MADIADTKIKNYKKYLKEAQKNMEAAEKSLNSGSYKLVSKYGMQTKDVKTIVDAGKIAYYPSASEEDRAFNNMIVTQWTNVYDHLDLIIEPLKDYGQSKYEVEYWQSEIDKAEAESKAPLQGTVVYEEQPLPEQEGHVYPVKLVQGWTNQLNYWNSVLDEFMKKLDTMSFDIDMTWLCKKCEWICRKINYALAMLRYTIIKTLSGMFKQAQDVMSLVDPIVNMSVTSPDACVGWVTNTIGMFMKPYMTIVTFIQDFMTYTPPLVEAAATLVGTAAQVPAKVLSRVNFVAEDKNGEKKELAEVYKQYIDIHMDPITLGDVMGGGVEKPQIAQYSANAQQHDILTNKMQTSEMLIEEWWQNFQKQIKETYKEDTIWIEQQWPAKINFIAKDNFDNYYLEKQNSVQDETTVALLVYEIAEARETAEKAKQKAIQKAEKAQKLAARNEQLAAKHILDDNAIKEAEQAKLEADEAVQKAKNATVSVDIPWGDYFNTNRYPVYPIITTKSLQGIATGGELYVGLLDTLITYYQNVYGEKGNAKVIAKTVNYITFLNAFKDAYPFIPDELDKLKELVIQYDKTKHEISDLNKRSIFK